MSDLALEDLIKRYKEAQDAWREKDLIDDRLGSNPVEWRAYMDASFHIIEHRCSSLEGVSRKSEFIVSDENLLDAVQNGCDGEALKAFLQSMVIEPDHTPPITTWHEDELALLEEIKAAKDRLAAIINRIEGKKQ